MKAIFKTGLLVAALAVITFVDSAIIPAGDECSDKLENCDLYSDYCGVEWHSWALVNCKKSCGLCGVTLAPPQCSYKGKSYAIGETWFDGCKYNCTCLDGRMTSCRGRCPTSSRPLPEGCTSEVPEGECCAKKMCVGLDGKTRKDISEGCVFKGRYYNFGDKWRKGCDRDYECKSKPDGFYLSYRPVCPRLIIPALPKGCSLELPEGECCKKVVCVGLDGKTKTARNKGCEYEKVFYNVGDKWKSGCDKSLECMHEPGRYFVRIKSKCVIYKKILEGCTLKVPEGECCPRPVCKEKDNTITDMSKGCWFKDVFRKEGETWEENCETKYKCLKKEGKYTIQIGSKCMNFDRYLEPDFNCTLTPPAPGLCCSQPSCPEGLKLIFPEDYVIE